MKSLLLLILVLALVKAKEGCSHDDSNCLSVGKNYCTPFVRINGDFHHHCECNLEVTTKIVINDLRYDFVCIPKLNLNSDYNVYTEYNFHHSYPYPTYPYSYTVTCNNSNVAVCCNSTSSLYYDYNNQQPITGDNGVHNYLVNVYCVDVSNNPYALTPSNNSNCSIYSDRQDLDSYFPNTSFCGWDFLEGWVQYDNSCEYYTSNNYTSLYDWGYYGTCCSSLAQVRPLPQVNTSSPMPYTSYNISDCGCNLRFLPTYSYSYIWFDNYTYYNSFYQWALNSIIPTQFFEGNWGTSLTCPENATPMYTDCDTMACKTLCTKGSEVSVIHNYTFFSYYRGVDVDVTPFKPYGCKCFNDVSCQDTKCVGNDCKYDCYSDGFNFISLASKPCDCNYTKVYDGMCYTPYNDCDNFMSAYNYTSRCTPMQYQWVTACRTKLCWGVETHMCNNTIIPVSASCVGNETWVYLDTFGNIQVYTSQQYNFYPCPHQKPKYGKVCHKEKCEGKHCSQKCEGKECHHEKCVEEQCNRCRHMGPLPHDTYCRDEVLNGECIPFLYSRCGSCEYASPAKSCYVDLDGDAWSFNNQTSFERWGPQIWQVAYHRESGSSTPAAAISGNTKHSRPSYRTNNLNINTNNNAEVPPVNVVPSMGVAN